MATDAALALPPAAPPARPRVLLVGTALAAAAAFMAIMAMVGSTSRSGPRARRWRVVAARRLGAAAHPGNMGMATMLLSAVTMWWAVDAVGRNDRPSAYLALGLTIMFGIAVINATTFLYTEVGLPVATLHRPALLRRHRRPHRHDGRRPHLRRGHDLPHLGRRVPRP
jgi:hypothetical protein